MLIGGAASGAAAGAASGAAMVLSRPGGLWLGLVLVPMLALYFLRMRYRRKAVGSIYIWRELLGPTSGGDSLKRRSILLLLLQVLAVALAAFAAAGPAIESRRLVKPGRAFLIDVSASMGTRDCAPLGGAGDEALKAISELGDDVPIMVFACSSSARPLLAEAVLDKGAAQAALRGLKAGSEALSEAGCADALSAWLARDRGSWQAVLYTDGGLDLGARALAAAFEDSGRGKLEVRELGSSGSSLGITGLRLESSGQGKSTARFTLWNGWAETKRARVELSRGKEELASLDLDAARGWSRASLDWPGDIEEGAYSLRISGESALAGAPGGEYFLSVSRRRALSVLLVGRSDPFVKAALEYGGIATSSAAEFPASTELFDIAIADGAKVPSGLRCHLLVFGEPPADAPVSVKGEASGILSAADSSHPLVRFVDWEGSSVEAGVAYSLRGQAQPLALAGGQCVLAAWDSGGYRRLACGIDLARSDLGLKSAFPVLLENFIEWCVPRTDDQSAFTLVAGEAARRSEDQAFEARGVELSREGPSVLLTGSDAGLFGWEDSSSSGGSRKGYIAVNVPAGELDVSPRSIVSIGEPPGQTALASAEIDTTGDLGGWALLGLCLCLAAEWLAWKGSGLRRGLQSRPAREAKP